VSDAIPTTKPYLFRAIYEWAEDNSFTPQVLVHDIFLPMESVLAIFARENSQGIFFEDTVLPDPVDPKPNGDKPKLSKTKPARKPDDSSAPKGNGSHLKIVK